MAKAIFSNAQVIASLTDNGGATWHSPQITYNFASSKVAGGSHLGANQMVMADYWMKAWSEVISPSIVRVADTAKASIQVVNSRAADYADSTFPDSRGAFVRFNPDYGDSSGQNNLINPKLGQWGGMVFGHELGHALGLSHPGAYDGGNPTYEANALYAQDSLQYTIMSYFSAAKTGSDWVASDGRSYSPQTPMMNDIMAIQAIYGADATTRTGDTTYGFRATAGNPAFDFSTNKHPVLCLYDSGGSDTLDLSGFSTSSRISLVAGSFSDCDAMTNNISIARGVVIENATGGSGKDTLIGNDANNVLNGGGNADIMRGGLGNDTYILDNNLDKVIEAMGQGLDTILASVGYVLAANVENLTLTGAAAINGSGNELGNVLTGNAANNTLMGGAGNDILIGGAGIDQLLGGTGADKFQFIGLSDSPSGNSCDVINDFNASQGDKIDLSILDASVKLPGNLAMHWADAGFSGNAGEACFSNGMLMCDYNGDARADFQVQLVGVTQLAHDSVLF